VGGGDDGGTHTKTLSSTIRAVRGHVVQSASRRTDVDDSRIERVGERRSRPCRLPVRVPCKQIQGAVRVLARRIALRVDGPWEAGVTVVARERAPLHKRVKYICETFIIRRQDMADAEASRCRKRLGHSTAEETQACKHGGAQNVLILS